MLSLIGPGGIGKTRLALHVADRARYLFLDGIVFVPLSNVKPTEPFHTPIAQALDLHTIKKGDIKAALIEYLRDREVLLILDNFEHLVDQAIGLSEILSEAPGVQLLITSREALGIRWETRYPLQGLPTPSEGDPDPLAYASAQLFVAASLRADPGFLPEPHGTTIGRICRQVDGTPLGIELAGALVGNASPQEIASEIEHNLELLAVSFKDVPRRHRSMRAVFEYSWDLLSPEEQMYLSRLAVFRGGFTPKAAFKVADCPGTILKRLIDKSLLFYADGRHDFHELIRRFALDKSIPADAAEMTDRHGAFFVAEMSEIMSEMVGISQPTMIQKIRQDYANFRVAWDFGLQQGKIEYLSSLLDGLARYFDLTSLFKDGEALMEEAERLLTKRGSVVGPDLLADLGNAKARFYNKQSRFEEAIAIVQGIAENRARSEHTRAFAYLEWGWALWHTGQYEEAESPLAQGQQLALRAEAPLLIANILRNLGIVAWYQSKPDKARVYTQQAYEFHQGIGDLQGMADALNNLALVAGDQGDYLASLDYLQQAIGIKEDLGDVNGRAISLGNLGTLYLFLGMYAEAEKTLDAGLALSQSVGNIENMGHSHTNRCGLFVLQGRFEEAKQEAGRALQLVRQSGDRFVEGYVLEFWGLAHEGAGELSQAETMFQKSLAIRRETGLDEMIYHALGKLTYNATRQQKRAAAAAYMREMEALFDGGNVKNIRVLQTGTFNCFRALDAVGDARALDYLRQAVHHLESQANKIIDPDLQRSFLENIKEHRLISAAGRDFLTACSEN
jgi:predicted ATPase/Tfp pilus assembly protein PilF